jgi:hypothetical protein
LSRTDYGLMLNSLHFDVVPIGQAIDQHETDVVPVE